ncbi:MAG TPA: hypothetical protein VL527_12540 [Dongiaceae bacterium]|nr:hypothetical protein [Dongiaceae bacterium]
MNANEMHSAWNSHRNNLPPEAQQRLVGQFTQQTIRRRRFQTFWLIHTFAWLTIITVLGIAAVLTGKTRLAHEWGLLPLLLIPWAFAIHFLRWFLRAALPTTPGELPVTESLRLALVSNQAQQTHLKLVAGLFAIMIPVLAMTLCQLYAVGKVSANDMVSMTVFFGAVLGLSAAGIAVRYFARLLPQQRQLKTLLAAMADEG